jgi:outer membrane protein OmpA-like peptidoglycan-associated protein
MNSTLKPLPLSLAVLVLTGSLCFLNGCHKSEPISTENALVATAQNQNSNPAQSRVPPGAVKETEHSERVASQTPANPSSKRSAEKALQSFGSGNSASDQVLARRYSKLATRDDQPPQRISTVPVPTKSSGVELAYRRDESPFAAFKDRAPNETTFSKTEQNAQRLSGQLDELAAIENSAKGGDRAAQEAADSEVAAVNATNQRISALDDYVPQTVLAVSFKVGSAVLSSDSKTKLDKLATNALNSKGYVLEVSGFTDTTGSVARNRTLNQRRADSVIRYLVENHQIPLRRIVTPYGFGESNPIAVNTSRSGRADNRRVEVKLLVNKGLMQAIPLTP